MSKTPTHFHRHPSKQLYETVKLLLKVAGPSFFVKKQKKTKNKCGLISDHGSRRPTSAETVEESRVHLHKTNWSSHAGESAFLNAAS